MRIDVSEIKTFKGCKRKWELSSRNKMHLQPKVTPPNYAFGTIFHDSLARLYLGESLQTVMSIVKQKMNPETDVALVPMLTGYFKEVLPEDLKRFMVLDIEHHFEIEPTTSDGQRLFPLSPVFDGTGTTTWEPSITICGSIDMIVLDVKENKIYGFEHKTCKNFRDESFLWMDEQPRVYTWALKKYAEEHNKRNSDEPATLGGVYLNEVRKLLRNFQYKRTLCTYSDNDLDNFMQVFFNDCHLCHVMVASNAYAPPKPSYFSCGMCEYKDICRKYMYERLDEKRVLSEFSEDFEKRTEDHLNEKVERSASNV